MGPTASPNSAIYSFTPTTAGLYEVFVTWPSSANASNHIEHIVTHACGSAIVFMDENNVSNPGGANHWNSLGQYTLNSSTLYTVTQTNQNYPHAGYIFRADAVDWRLIEPGQAPTITQQPTAQELCAGDTAVFAVTAAGEGTLLYQWRKNESNLIDGGHYSGATTATLVVSNVNTADVADYRCVVATGCLTSTSNTAALTLRNTVAADFDCDGDVDQTDFGHFQSCLTGLGLPLTDPQCQNADLDRDPHNDVDMNDFDVFQSCLSGPNQPATGCTN